MITKLREDKSPNRLVSDIKRQAKTIAMKQKSKEVDERPALQLYTESDDEEY
jgi:hypothetical protein